MAGPGAAVLSKSENKALQELFNSSMKEKNLRDDDGSKKNMRSNEDAELSSGIQSVMSILSTNGAELTPADAAKGVRFHVLKQAKNMLSYTGKETTKGPMVQVEEKIDKLLQLKSTVDTEGPATAVFTGYTDLLDACDTYIGKKNPWTTKGKQRMALVKGIYAQAIAEYQLLAKRETYEDPQHDDYSSMDDLIEGLAYNAARNLIYDGSDRQPSDTDGEAPAENNGKFVMDYKRLQRARSNSDVIKAEKRKFFGEAQDNNTLKTNGFTRQMISAATGTTLAAGLDKDFALKMYNDLYTENEKDETTPAKVSAIESIFATIMNFDLSRTRIDSIDDVISGTDTVSRLVAHMTFDAQAFFEAYAKLLNDDEKRKDDKKLCSLTKDEFKEVKTKHNYIYSVNSWFSDLPDILGNEDFNDMYDIEEVLNKDTDSLAMLLVEGQAANNTIENQDEKSRKAGAVSGISKIMTILLDRQYYGLGIDPKEGFERYRKDQGASSDPEEVKRKLNERLTAYIGK